MKEWEFLLQGKLEATDASTTKLREQLKPLPRFMLDMPEQVPASFEEPMKRKVANYWAACKSGLTEARLSATLVGDLLAEASIAFNTPLFGTFQAELNAVLVSQWREEGADDAGKLSWSVWSAGGGGQSFDDGLAEALRSCPIGSRRAFEIR